MRAAEQNAVEMLSMLFDHSSLNVNAQTTEVSAYRTFKIKSLELINALVWGV